MYQTITLRDGSVYGCENYRGIFKKSKDGSTWIHQCAGTCQTPKFRSAAHFSEYLHRRAKKIGNSLSPMVSADWWEKGGIHVPSSKPTFVVLGEIKPTFVRGEIVKEF